MSQQLNYQKPLQEKEKQQSSYLNKDLDHVYLFSLNISKYPKSIQLAICVFGTFLFYIVYGFFQEKIFNIKGFKYGWYLTLFQFVVYAIFSSFERHMSGTMNRKSPLRNYLYIAFFMVMTMGLSNSSLQYLNYPTQVLIKSCKIIPSMIGGFFILGKKYSYLEILSAILLSLGLIELTLGNAYADPLTFNFTGIFMLLSALFADSFIGNNQEKVMSQYKVTTHEMIFYTHAFGSIFLLIITLIFGEFFNAIKHSYQNPITIIYILSFSISGYIGVNVVLALIKIFGAFITISITSCRKFVTVWLSFIIFPKPISIHYFISCLFILTGIGCHIYYKNSEEINIRLKKLHKTLFDKQLNQIEDSIA